MRRRHLRLVGKEDPTDVFNDLDRLRREQREGVPKRSSGRYTETFARIPHDRALALYPLVGKAAFAVLIELDRLVFKTHRNPVRFSSNRLTKLGIRRDKRARALRQLEAAGIISVEPSGRGSPPWVTYHWFGQT